MAIVAAAVLVVGGLAYGGIKSSKELKKAEAKANDATRQAIDEIKSVGIPEIEAQKIVLENPKLIFKYAPELEQYYELGKSQVGEISADPKLKDAQLSALEKLTQVGAEGFTEEDKNTLNFIKNKADNESKSRSETTLQNLQSRGMGSESQELALKAMGSQQAMVDAANRGDEMKSMAYNRALEAMAQGGELGGSIRRQEFGEQADTASAQDFINQFNVKNQQSVHQRNIGSLNAAELERERLKQNLEEDRVNIANEQEIHNKGLLQQKFENEMAKAGFMVPRYQRQAGSILTSAGNRAANTMKTAQNVDNAAMAGMSAYSGGGGGGGYAQAGKSTHTKQASQP